VRPKGVAAEIGHRITPCRVGVVGVALGVVVLDEQPRALQAVMLRQARVGGPGPAAVREVPEETGLAVAPRRVLGERIHPATGKRLTYVACEVITGTADAADAGEVDGVEWVPIGGLGEYVPFEFLAPVQEYLDAVLAAQ
jgi:8-oxo-dGTP pyrophosphatase MutT (NUDIX family)